MYVGGGGGGREVQLCSRKAKLKGALSIIFRRFPPFLLNI